jgi:PPOX class probable F420-dependent enzyme
VGRAYDGLRVVGTPRGSLPGMPAAPIPRAIHEFLAQPNIAVVATIMPSGYPHTAATWYDWEGGRILVNMDESRRRLEYMRLNPRVALTAMEEREWGRQVSVMGEVESLEPDADMRDIDRLAVRYTGEPFSSRNQRRWSAWVRVERWYGWSGIGAWPEGGS